MAGGLAALLDDVATLAKLAAASVDDVGAAAGRAGAKAAGVVVDDAAVTPRYVHNFAADRELPMIRKIALGSFRNKLLFIVPAALLMSQFVPWLLTPLLMLGGTYLCFEGAEKLWEKLGGGHGGHSDGSGHGAHDAATGEHGQTVVRGDEFGPHSIEREDKMVSSAIRTDFILSAEIMVIALNEVTEEPLISRTVIMIVVAIGITILIYGVVGLIVKIDDIGLHLAERESEFSQTVGRALVRGMPHFMSVLSTVGVVAMLWVGGHILLVGFNELGWHWPYDQVHHLEEWVADTVSTMSGFLSWVANTLASAFLGVIAGAIAVTVMHNLPQRQAATADSAA